MPLFGCHSVCHLPAKIPYFNNCTTVWHVFLAENEWRLRWFEENVVTLHTEKTRKT
jgi:hypothetical protein